jgi:hypothetical protein
MIQYTEEDGMVDDAIMYKAEKAALGNMEKRVFRNPL